MGQNASTQTELSIIIPVLNEGRNLEAAVNSVRSDPSCQPEIIVVDGGSTDDTAKVAKRLGCKTIRSGRGRGLQQDLGWRAASGEWCLFLHADSRLPPAYWRALQPLLQQSRLEPSQQSSPQQSQHKPDQPQWGCFKTIRTEWSDTWQGKLLSAGVELRTRLLGQPYGDQALFVKRSLLQQVGGFPAWPLLEDIELVARLKSATHQGPHILPLPVHTSGRRWEALGFCRAFVLNQTILMGWRLGVPPDTLAAWYYSARRNKPGS